MPETPSTTRSPWAWVPTVYLAEGLPYVVVMSVSVILYKRLGISNTDIALYTSWLYLPWVIKPLWSPVVDTLRTRRLWIVVMQFLVGAGLAALALVIPGSRFFEYSLAVFYLIAFSSATQDIAIDGFYLLALDSQQQSFFVGIRSTFYRIASICGQGLLVMLAGFIEDYRGYPKTDNHAGAVAFSWAFALVGILFLGFALYHAILLPKPASDHAGEAQSVTRFWGEFFSTFGDFFKKPQIGRMILFLLLYRFAEAQLVKMVSPFLLDPHQKGGLGLTTQQVGFAYGTVGIAFLTLGGILGGWVVSRDGLKRWLWPMVIAIHLPDTVFVYLAWALPQNLALINGCIALEQFGYGFGFAAYMLYMIRISRGKHPTAHYAICTGFMALGMMIPGMFSGWIQDNLGYRRFFIWVLLSTLPGFLVVRIIPLESDFGRKQEAVVK